MAPLTAKQRKSLPKSEFALPGSRRFPVDTRARAANAKARATQQFEAGNISESTMRKIHAAANKVLKRKGK